MSYVQNPYNAKISFSEINNSSTVKNEEIDLFEDISKITLKEGFT